MIDAIVKRRSIRKYKEKKIEPEKLEQILESARIAPSGSNTQPWHLIVVNGDEMRTKLAEASHNQKWMLTAPTFIVCVADIQSRLQPEETLVLDEDSSLPELKMIIRDTSIAIDHMVLTAESLGLGACWVAWFTQDQIRPILNIPTDKYVVCILTMGYPDETPNARPRKNLSDFMHYEQW